MPPTPALPLSPNPNLYQTPTLQPADCVEWSPAGQYFMGDCVLRGATFNNDTQRWEGGQMFFLLALVGSQTVAAYTYGSVGLTSDPLISQLSLNGAGVDFNNGWIQATPIQVGPNPRGAQWVNLSLLSPAVRPWNNVQPYNFGDIVYYPDPTVVWRATETAPAGLPPNVPGLNTVGINQINTAWALISNPQQYSAFNETPVNVIGTSILQTEPQPLPPTRALPL